ADAGAVRAGHDRQRELVRRPGRVADEQVAAVDRRRLQLDDDLARPGLRVWAVAVLERAALDDVDRLHRSELQGSSVSTATATYPPSVTAGASTTASCAGSAESLYE